MLYKRALGLVVVVVVLAACGVEESDREAIGSDGSSSSETSADAAGDEPEESSTTTSTTTTTTVPEQDLTVESGHSSGVNSIGTRHTSAGALVTNPNESLAAYGVTAVFNLLDADGNILDTSSADVPYIPAGTTVPVAPSQIGFDIAAEPASVQVDIAGNLADDTGWDGVEFMMGDGVDLGVADAAIAPGTYGTDLSFTASNPSDAVVEYATWSCVFRNGGAIVGGQRSGISDAIVPGGSVRVDTSVAVDGLTADEVLCRAHA